MGFVLETSVLNTRLSAGQSPEASGSDLSWAFLVRTKGSAELSGLPMWTEMWRNTLITALTCL